MAGKILKQKHHITGNDTILTHPNRSLNPAKLMVTPLLKKLYIKERMGSPSFGCLVFLFLHLSLPPGALAEQPAGFFSTLYYLPGAYVRELGQLYTSVMAPARYYDDKYFNKWEGKYVTMFEDTLVEQLANDGVIHQQLYGGELVRNTNAASLKTISGFRSMGHLAGADMVTGSTNISVRERAYGGVTASFYLLAISGAARPYVKAHAASPPTKVNLVPLGEGEFSRAFLAGEHVIKVLRLRPRGRALTAIERRGIAEVTAQAMEELGAHPTFKTLIPKTEVFKEVSLITEFRRGHPLSALRDVAPDFTMATDTAAVRMQTLVREAATTLGLEEVGYDVFAGTRMHNGRPYQISIDANFENFLYEITGEPVAWFDPYIVLPKK